MASSRPNVLLVVMDTARADAFEPYGAAPGATPTIAQMASTGRAYQAVAPACWTAPSHGSLFTGLSYRAAGFGMPASLHADFKEAGERLEHRWLPSVLREAGYDTAGVSTNVWVSALSGFDRGFDEFSQLTGPRNLHQEASSWRERAEWALQALRARVDDGAAEVERLIDAWMSRRSGKPFFWFVNLVECHSPYLPPRPYNVLSPLDRIKAADEARRFLNFDAIWKGLCGGTEAPPDALDRMRRLYAGAIRLMDDWFARVFDRLERAGLLDETIVVATSDHGENLGENDLLGHGFSLDDRLIRVPLVVSGPARPLPTPVASLADVPAWLGSSIELDDSPWGDPLVDREVAIAQFDAPAPADDWRSLKAIEMWGFGDEELRRLTTSFTCATNGRRKLLHRLGREELIDLDTDPLEQSPRILGRAEEDAWGHELKSLRAALDEAAREEQAGVVQLDPTPLAADEAADLEAQMKLLGYL